MSVAKELKGTGLDAVFIQYIRKVLEKIPKGLKLYKDLLAVMNTEDPHSLHCDIDNGGRSTFSQAPNDYIEVFDSK